MTSTRALFFLFLILFSFINLHHQPLLHSPFALPPLRPTLFAFETILIIRLGKILIIIIFFHCLFCFYFDSSKAALFFFFSYSLFHFASVTHASTPFVR